MDYGATILKVLISLLYLFSVQKKHPKSKFLNMIRFHDSFLRYYTKIDEDINKWALEKSRNFIVASIFSICPLIIVILVIKEGILLEFQELLFVFVGVITPIIMGITFAHKNRILIELNWSSINEDIIRKSIQGSMLSFGVSMLVLFVALFATLITLSKTKITITQITIVLTVFILSSLVVGYLMINIATTSTCLLWKARVPSFADSLPMLLIKTKTGDIFFGQLYDPLENNALILRKAKIIIHNGQEVENIIKKVVSHKVPLSIQENYLAVPWDTIEVLQIVEDGLYKSLNKNKQEF